jgi:acyl-CoA synthetase (AMP-forming)/AMP-acid ligase II
VANALRGRRLEPGDRVAVLSRNVSELWELFLGCALSGTVLCLINVRLMPEHKTTVGERPRDSTVYYLDELPAVGVDGSLGAQRSARER